MNIVVLTAGGTGTRTHQDLPKQFISVDNKPIIIYTLEAFQQHPNIDAIYVACLDGWTAILEAYAKQFNITKLKRVVIGGLTGQLSIYNGLKAIKEDNNNTDDITVLIHDGNRPMVSQDIITDSLVKQKQYGSAVAVVPTTEVVFVSKNGFESNAALNREELWRTQTPHAYNFNELWDIQNKAIADGVNNMAASCSLMQKYGFTTYFSKGSEKNIKITTIEDIEIFKALLNAKNDEWIKK
ncbi:MAG: 2-C-methyl-D-erythritol 4-phosphate cytidylyltransferase [Bacilli bacterium]|nr:2-C-methyl-D-erythritol 4-phosphate cytidylyltransferase [Bacilli bacterium]